jgi:beta-galactosidase
MSDVVWDLSASWSFGPATGRATDFAEVTLPHCVASLSWGSWDPRSWESTWIYRRQVALPADALTGRLFLEFDGAMTAVTVDINGRVVGKHIGGYLPFAFEVTGLLRPDVNVLTVTLDATFDVDVPPNVPGQPSNVIDFWQPGGLYRGVRLRAVPSVYISALAPTAVAVLDPARRRLLAETLIDGVPHGQLGLSVTLLDKRTGAVVCRTHSEVDPRPPKGRPIVVELVDLAQITLWDVDEPALYVVRATLTDGGVVVHERDVTTGFRFARFETNGFFLNGHRLPIMGANRHQLYPWTGFAMPDRAQRKDAELLKHELNCTMVRCAHYPPAPAFLDACDELGLLVWEEPPGWQHLGDARWRDCVCRDVAEMIQRDRHRPSVIIWGVRLNEMPDDADLWSRTQAVARQLDPGRQTSGTMHEATYSSDDFQQDVFAYDDYRTTDVGGDRRPDLLPPREGWPYLLAEAVSERCSPSQHYRRTDASAIQQHQALDYAYAFDAVRADDRYCGLLAWSAIDYQTGFPGDAGVKRCGLADVFRVPKPGAAFYRSQVNPRARPVIEPAFAWDLTDSPTGPGPGSVVCSNLDRLVLYVDDVPYATSMPAHAEFPHLEHPPFIVDLTVENHSASDLRIDGYLDGVMVASRAFAGDRSRDRFAVHADDDALVADGSDATRVVAAVTDAYGTPRARAGGVVSFALDGPADIVGDNPLSLTEHGGVAAIWIRTRRGGGGAIRLDASHDILGAAERVTLRSHPPR